MNTTATNSDVLSAIDAYEFNLSQFSPSMSDYKNLLVLYWLCTDPGFSSAHSLPAEHMALAGDRLRQMVEDVYSKSDCADLMFWVRYFKWADLGDELSVDWCQELLSREDCSLDPVLYIYATSSGVERRDEAMILLETAVKECTFRGDYIASVISAVLERSENAVTRI